MQFIFNTALPLMCAFITACQQQGSLFTSPKHAGTHNPRRSDDFGPRVALRMSSIKISSSNLI